MEINDIPYDVLQKIFSFAAEPVDERARMQKSLLFVNRHFFNAVLRLPLLSIEEALRMFDPLAANIAFISMCKYGNIKKELLKSPMIVGVALRVHGRKPDKRKGLHGRYIDQLGGIIAGDVASAFSNIEIVCEIADTLLIRDDWKTLACAISRGIITRGKDRLRILSLIRQRTHPNCLLLLSEWPYGYSSPSIKFLVECARL